MTRETPEGDARRGESEFERWVGDSESPPAEAVPAATLILVRDMPAGGIEALMLRRSSALAFAGGMWVFPGGRVDPEDHLPGRPADIMAASRRAAVREATEEAGLAVAPETLVAFSHWTPPPGIPRRFSTWFFIAPAPEGSVRVDGGEIREHAWLSPSDAIRRRDGHEIELAPPTWITLHRLAAYESAAHAVSDARRREPEIFSTHIARVEGGVAALYHGDAGYEDADAARPGSRHRLWMLEEGWRYEQSADLRRPAPS